MNPRLAGGPPPPLGASVHEHGTTFVAFVTASDRCAVRLVDENRTVLATHTMRADADGFFRVDVPGVGHGALYQLVVGERVLPDPYARFLPQGVHGPAMVVEPRHVWRHGAGIARPLHEHVVYEIHVGTFTPEGTYTAAARHLGELAALGVTTIELMPISAFPGTRGWGYDGVAHFAPFAPYGTPDELRRFVDTAHGHGLCVWLDVVYNHFGPSGMYLSAFSPTYFTSAYATPWGDAPDYTNAVMRRYVIDNAIHWLRDFRFDGLRLDAIFAIHDPSPVHVLRELADAVATLEPPKLLVAEDERNDATHLRSLGLHAVWADDFHHQMRVTLTGENDGYYAAYRRSVDDLARTIERGWLYEGQHYAPHARARGRPAGALEAEQLVYCIQNHDQIGNRALGDRITNDVSIDASLVAATTLLFLPMTPLLFMGQEWAASTPFAYFTDHEEELGRAVSSGRRAEFASFAAFADPVARRRIPDPQALETFERCKLLRAEQSTEPHAHTLSRYRALLALRRDDPVLRAARRATLRARAHGDVLVVWRWIDDEARVLLASFSDSLVAHDSIDLPLASATPLFETRAGAWTDGLAPRSAVVLAVPRSAVPLAYTSTVKGE